MTEKQLALLAIEAMKSSYSPYSGYTVGAALITDDDQVYMGCNIENASFSTTICAERTAFFNAISDGKRNFKMLAVVGGKNGRITGAFPPCGACRQVMNEFCMPNFKIIIVKDSCAESLQIATLGELLPNSFNIEMMKD